MQSVGVDRSVVVVTEKKRNLEIHVLWRTEAEGKRDEEKHWTTPPKKEKNIKTKQQTKNEYKNR